METMTTTSFDDSLLTSSLEVGRLILLLASLMIGIIGVLGNGLVAYVCVRYPLRGVTNVFVCNQSLIDLFTSIVFLARYGMLSGMELPASTTPNAANFLCKFWFSDYLLWGLADASTINLIFLTIERYLAVFYPMLYRTKLTKTKGKLLAIVPWFYGLTEELLWALLGNKYVEYSCKQEWINEAAGLAVGILDFSTVFLLPIIVMIYVDIRIWHKLRKTDSTHQFTVTEKLLHNVVKTLAIVSLSFVICWGPLEVLYFYSNISGFDLHMTGTLYISSVVLALANMSLNPFIYAFNYQDFRSKLAQVLTLR